MERSKDKPASRRESSELAGSHLLLAEIGRGELTTVYLAKKHGALGFQRLYALKRLKPALAHSAESVALLLDGARLLSGIHHANVAGVLEVGTDAGTYVIMEYVEGENLEVLLARAGTARHPRYIVPPFVDALNGLHALHTASDADGEPYAIVHQGPRARHIVLGVDGTARLVDFSQVRGRGVLQTRARSDRIKVAYMAPEQALHPDGVDLRSDLFIVGITLWEALTGERLFAADTDEQTFQNMLHRRVPRPSEVGLRPPRCFDAICMRALERDPKSRYPSAQAMARDLRDTAINQALYATASELGQWVRNLAGSELRTLRKLAGQDVPSSGAIPLDTPATGVDLSGLHDKPARLSDGLVAVPSKSEASNDDPYATGRIYGGSEARVARELDTARTPAVGYRRSKPLEREERDDEATGPLSLLAEGSTGPVYDQRARAATVPFVAPVVLAHGGAPARVDSDEEQTNPAVFVPERAGARREANRASPGSYSQVDLARRQSKTRAADTELEVPNAKALLAHGSEPFEEADTTLRQAPAPGSAEGGSGAPRAIAETKSYVAASFDAGVSDEGSSSMQSRQRRGAAVEHPAEHVHRSDSSPTRMEIPIGPVGSPHRSLQWPSAHAPAGWSATGMPDSLTPPATASRTAPPRGLQPAPRHSALWLVSGVLAAIILLALGVGVRQWIADRDAPRSVSHAASGGASAGRHEPQLQAEPAPPPPAAVPPAVAPSPMVPPAVPQSPATANEGFAPAAELPRDGATSTRGDTPPQRRQPRAASPVRRSELEIKPSRPAPVRREPALPDNPY